MKIRTFTARSALALAMLIGAEAAVAADGLTEIQALISKGQGAEALSKADALLKREPHNAQVQLLKGVALAGLNRHNDAIEVFVRMTREFPAQPEPYNNLAVLYAQQQDYDKARSALEAALRTHPSYATAHRNLGDVFARLASQAYEKALPLDAPRTPQTPAPLALLSEIKAPPGAAASAPAPTVIATAPPASTPVQSAALPPRTQPAPQPTDATPVPAPQPSAPQPAAVAAPPAIASASTASENQARAQQGPRPADPPQAQPAAPAKAPPPVVAPAQAKAGDSAPSAHEAELGRTVTAWAQAWSSKKVQDYLAHYDADFRPPGGRSRTEWERERTQRVGKPGPITVEVEGLDVTLKGDTATVRFRQNYRSSGFKSTTMKTLEFVRRGERWRITRELAGG